MAVASSRSVHSQRGKLPVFNAPPLQAKSQTSAYCDESRDRVYLGDPASARDVGQRRYLLTLPVDEWRSAPTGGANASAEAGRLGAGSIRVFPNSAASEPLGSAPVRRKFHSSSHAPALRLATLVMMPIPAGWLDDSRSSVSNQRVAMVSGWIPSIKRVLPKSGVYLTGIIKPSSHCG